MKIVSHTVNVGLGEMVRIEDSKFFQSYNRLAGFAAPCYGFLVVGNSTFQGMESMRTFALIIVIIGFFAMLTHQDAFADDKAPIHIHTFTGPGVDRIIGEALAAAFQSALTLQTGRQVFTDADLTSMFEPVSRKGEHANLDGEKHADWIWAALAQYGASDTIFGRLTVQDGKRAQLRLLWYQNGKILHETTESLSGGRGGWLRSMEDVARKFLLGMGSRP